MTIALLVILVYALAGLFFALYFLTRLAPKHDPALKSSPAHVRMLLIPGAIALWPLLLIKSLTQRSDA